MGHTSSNKNVTNGIWQKVAVATMMVTILFFASKEIKESLRLLEDTEHPADLENPKDFRLMKGLFFAPPCGHNNVRYEVVSHPAYGKLCLEKLEHGNELIKDWLRKGFVWEKDLIPYFEKHIRNDSVVIDVGAHIGLHTLLFSNLVGDKGKVLAFEPNLKIFQELLANIYINGPQNIFAEFVALGSQKSLVNMEPTRSGNEGGTTLGDGGNFVELRTLDSYKLQNISLLKIDVEGAELGVLHGAISTIKNSKPVIMIELREDTKEQAYKILGSLGYELQQIIGELQDHNYIAIPKLSSPKQ